MKIPTIELELIIAKSMDCDNSTGLRGFIGRYFSEDVLLHNHDYEGFVYSYPRVQYKVIDKTAKIIGLAEGFKSVKNIPKFDKITLGHEDFIVIDMDLMEKQASFGILESQNPYSFITPWLALNEKNYEKYRRFGRWDKKKELLEKILIGNIISMSKSLGYTVPEPIIANIGKLKEVNTSLKGTPMIGFLGDFSVNFEIPDYWGIGKSVSRGFGTVKRVNELKS